MMQHAAVSECPFKDTCETCADPLIAEVRKGSKGLGCEGQNDYHRSRHCKSFRCKYLSVALSELLAPRAAAAAANS